MTPDIIARNIIELTIEEASGLNDIGRRILANRIIGSLSAWLPEDKKAECGILEPMTDEEAKRAGRGETLPFGKHKGRPLDEVDMDYLVWIADESRKTWKLLHRYLNSPRILRERIYSDA